MWHVCFFKFLQHLRVQYDGLVPALCNNYPDVFPPELYTWEQFLWACELWYSNSMKVKFPDGKLRTCLIPIAGFLNHSVCHSSFFFAICVLSHFFLYTWLIEVLAPNRIKICAFNIWNGVYFCYTRMNQLLKFSYDWNNCCCQMLISMYLILTLAFYNWRLI